MSQTGKFADLKLFIKKCKRPGLDRLLKLTNLPRGGLKQDIQLRLLAYIEQDPPLAFISALRSLINKSSGFTTSDHVASTELSHFLCNGRNGPHQCSSSSVSNMPIVASYTSLFQPENTASIASSPDNQHIAISTSGTRNLITDQCRNDSPVVYHLPVTRLGPLLYLAGPAGPFRLPVELTGFRFKESPFFKELAVVQEPHLLTPAHVSFATGRRSYEKCVSFNFTSDQAETITYHCRRNQTSTRLEFGVQVVLRFARLDPPTCLRLARAYNLQPRDTASSIDQPVGLHLADDSLPIHLVLEANQRPVPLPPLLPSGRQGMDGRRHARPIDVTQFLRASPAAPNHLKMVWTHDYTSFTYYVVGIYLMQKRSSQQLATLLLLNAFYTSQVMKLELMKKFQPLSQASQPNSPDDSNSNTHRKEHSEAKTSTSNDDEDDIVLPTSLPVQLLCPLSKCRIVLPVRSRACGHLQCFDATTYLVVNERKPVWRCPVCDQSATYDKLIVDGLFLDVLHSEQSSSLDEVFFHCDGSWSVVTGPRGIASSSDDEDDDKLASQPAKPDNTRQRAVTSANRTSPLRSCTAATANSPEYQATENPPVIDLTASDDEPADPETGRPTTVSTQSTELTSPVAWDDRATTSSGSRQPTSSVTRLPHPPPLKRAPADLIPQPLVVAQSPAASKRLNAASSSAATIEQQSVEVCSSSPIIPNSIASSNHVPAVTGVSKLSRSPATTTTVSTTSHTRMTPRLLEPSGRSFSSFRMDTVTNQPSLDNLIAMCSGTGYSPVGGAPRQLTYQSFDNGYFPDSANRYHRALASNNRNSYCPDYQDHPRYKRGYWHGRPFPSSFNRYHYRRDHRNPASTHPYSREEAPRRHR